ncbi:MAG: natural product biosynthesis luciferase-like monooxygenase protein, partial [Phenylobacterium sp.]
MSNDLAFDSLLAVCQHQANSKPHNCAFTWLKDGETEQGSLTFAQVDHQARAIASQLQSMADIGERALLLFEPGLDFIVAFFGCIYAGIIAVPAYPPRANQLHFKRLALVVEDAQASIVLHTSDLSDKVSQWTNSAEGLGSLKTLVTDTAMASVDDWQAPFINADSLAFIQYTSGSTGQPKGVLVSHGNVISNQQRISAAFNHDAQTVVVGWLPQYHDMGLIGNLLQPLTMGVQSVMMSPRAFLQKPLRWLQAISDYKATTSGGPNFAYDLCIRHITEQQKTSLDLSHWQVAFNGAEVVRADTMARFIDAFGPCGFSKNAFLCCYGMAETTLLATSSAVQQAPDIGYFSAEHIGQNKAVEITGIIQDKDVLPLAASGQTQLGDALLIVDPATGVECPDGDIGEIWFNGPGVCQGYWQKPQLSEASFAAMLQGKKYLRTGDLGFVYQQQLYVTGRCKELIIIRGRNHYPQDIEKTIQDACESLVPGGGAAFAIDYDSEERLVVVQEVQRTHLRKLDEKAVFGAARSAVSECHELQLHDLVLIKPGRIPKTSSGKIKRKECQNRYIADDLADLIEICRLKADPLSHGCNTPTNPAATTIPMLQNLDQAQQTKAIADYLQSVLAQLVKCEVALDVPISSLGLDSLTAIEFLQRVDSEMQLHFELDNALESVLDGATITSLAAAAFIQVASNHAKASHDNFHLDDEDEIPSVAPPALALNQQALWFLYQMAPQNPAYNLALPIVIKQAVNESQLNKVVHQLVERHPMLTSRFEVDSAGNIQVSHGDRDIDLLSIDVPGLAPDVLQQMVQGWVNKPFDLIDGNVMRMVLFNIADNQHILLFVTHHIISDLWSMQLLLRDFCQCYSAALKGKEAPLTPITARYEDFVHWQYHWIGSEAGQKARVYWLEQLANVPTVLNLPLDRPRPHLQTHHVASDKFVLPVPLSAQLADFAKAQGATLFVTLLSVFQLTMQHFSGQQDICTGVPASGRSKAEFADVMGYFVSPMAIRTVIDSSLSLIDVLNLTKRRVLGALPHQHFVLHGIMDQLCPVRDPSVNPLYQTWFQLEQPRQLEAAAPLLLGDEADIELDGLKLASYAIDEPGAKLDLALTLVDLGDQLSGRWVYNVDLFDLSTVQRIHTAFIAIAQALMTNPQQAVGELDLNREGLCYGPSKPLSGQLVHQVIEQQVKRNAAKTALVYYYHQGQQNKEQRLSFAGLNRRANQIAHYLLSKGIQVESRVLVCMPRCGDLVAAQLAILKVGAAFIPLDPTYPADRLQYVINDANVARVLTLDDNVVFDHGVTVDNISQLSSTLAAQADDNPGLVFHPDNLAYLIYTSGSTGQPKGVMISHGNVDNFFIGMDAALDEQADTTVDKAWLAVSSASFDISILELFWTLSRGFKVVMQPEDAFGCARKKEVEEQKNIDFSLYYFADDNSADQRDCYQLLLDGARFADDNGFQAVWVPERHFHSFGGQYANPSVIGAAVAVITKNVAIRSGSVVVPLHDPIRITEEWSMVDNLSNGRVGLSVASGWNPDDFALNPEGFATRHADMYTAVDTVKKLWQGESITRLNGEGKETCIHTFPRPVQKQLPIWVTAAGHPDTFRSAGAMGANLLTHLLGQSSKEISEKLDIYRQAREDAGLDRDGGHITLMIHTFVSDDASYAMDIVEQPFKSYLRSSVGLMKPLAQQLGIDFIAHQDLLVEQSFQRYSTTSALFGSPESCLDLVNNIKEMGIDEVACLIDFGVAVDETLDNLPNLVKLRNLANGLPADGKVTASSGPLAYELIKRHNISHLQCTPTFARMLLQDYAQQDLPLTLQKMLVGGEAFPPDLLPLLKAHDIGEVYNMYGPTETTIWSSVAKMFELEDQLISLGQSIDNTGLYVLNEALQSVPFNVEGELYISGQGLARGYWQRPDLTAERFLPDPFASTPGELMYRTGDMVKRR